MLNKENTTNNFEKNVDVANAIVTETRLHFDTLVQMQMEERQQMEQRNFDEKKQIRKHYGAIILGLVVTLVVLLSGIFGGLFYLLNNYDFATVYQETSVAGDGSPVIHDGVRYTVE